MQKISANSYYVYVHGVSTNHARHGNTDCARPVVTDNFPESPTNDLWVMSYVSNMASAPSIFCLRISPHFSLDRVWMKQVWHEDKGLTSYYSCMLNWEE